MSIFTKAWGSIKTFFKKNKVVVEKAAEIAVKVVDVVKGIVDSPFINLAVNFTKTDIDDKALSKVRELLPKISAEILIAQGLLKPGMSADQIIANLVLFLKNLGVDERTQYWIDISARITQDLADDKMSLVEAISVSQEIYRKLHPESSQNK